MGYLYKEIFKDTGAILAGKSGARDRFQSKLMAAFTEGQKALRTRDKP